MGSVIRGYSVPQPSHKCKCNISQSNLNQQVNSSFTFLSPTQTTTPKQQKNSLPPSQYSPGELGKLARMYARELAQLGWNKFFRRHTSTKSINETLSTAAHPTAPYLSRLARHGLPVPLSAPPWSRPLWDAVFTHGPHASASKHFPSFLLEDMFDYVRQGYWLVLPYLAMQKLPQLKLSPSGIVPQHKRPPTPSWITSSPT
jgi:hypothetical protein